MKEKRVVVNDKMQRGYVYHRSEQVGRNFSPNFRPQLTPKQTLQLGVFGGKYMTRVGRTEVREEGVSCRARAIRRQL